MSRLVSARAARHDLADIIEYNALDGPTSAQSVFRSIVAATEKLVTYPAMGRVRRVPHTRELVIAGLPYLLVYHVTNSAVIAVAAFYGARDLARALAERRTDSPDGSL